MSINAETQQHEPAMVAGGRAGGGSLSAMAPADLAELLGTFNDVTAKLNAAHESLHSEVARLQGELRAANDEVARSKRLAALGEMAAGIAHEVRNPLGSIRLYARMLEQDLADRPADRQHAERILASVRGLDAVVGDVLSFAREMRACPEGVDAAELLRSAADEAIGDERMLAGVRVVVAETGCDRVWCDPSLTHRALVNVIRNGAEAARSAGEQATVWIGSGHRTLMGAEGRGQSMAALIVRDNGPGISAEVKERMFNPFFTTRATGTGLGLAIVHRIMDVHGGRVRVFNSADGGAVVELLFASGVEPRDSVTEGGRLVAAGSI
ncbi:MAG: hypothetical protein H7Y88_06510 [Phycisphaerales bacterium]|nr:hypothetical protein [Phycisphaerales bacterium]